MPMMQPMGVPGAPMFPPQGAGHGQMLFTTTQRPQPKLPGPHTRTYNILPMISFKVIEEIFARIPLFSRCPKGPTNVS